MQTEEVEEQEEREYAMTQGFVAGKKFVARRDSGRDASQSL